MRGGVVHKNMFARVGVGVKKPKRRRAGTREQRAIRCVSEHLIHHDEATMTRV